ncbi:hypothetical protein IR151_04425, partial [Clostridioides sp. ES-S-0006-03]|uniref:BppU family phage baseplate upper protein n=1 Tax=Clostridioides sp. ES-S-0006-03 TaxID=2770775 RepID=UPI001D0C50B0|nr:hypothetical protein [Clostridioides sp. ES-S-0006-03]
MRNRDYEVKQYFLEIDFSEYENRKNIVKKIIYSENDINTAFIKAQLKNDGKIMDLSNYDVIVNIWKNVGNKVNSPCVILDAENGEVEIPITREALKGAGINPFTIMAINSEGSLESPRFYYRVEEGLVNDDDIENADEFGVLVLLISQVKEVLKDNDILVTRVENLENLIEEQEEIREANELVRKENEEVRKTSEETREANELVRKENEEVRKTSEETREANELVRKENEEIRKTSEETREANELVRKENEEIRKTSEETREANELVRKESEEVRKTSEETREANELVRKENEEIRKTQEIDRQNSIKRMEKELIDKTDEKFNEVDITLDNKLKEQQKQLDDKIVETNNKINEVDTKIVEVDNKIVEVDTAKTDMTTTVSNKLTEFEQRFEELESTNTTGEIIQTREAYDGTQKNTLKERFTYDFDKVYEKIAEMSSAATNVAFSKSYVESDWLSDGEYFKLTVNHNLVTENIFVAILDEATKKSMTNSYTVVDSNTIEIFNESNIDVKVTVVNGNTNKEVITATINDNITTLDSTYSSVKIDSKIGVNELSTNAKNLTDAVNELFQSVSNGKELIATAITDKKVPTNSSDTFQTMASNISSIKQMPDMPSDVEEVWQFAGHTLYIKSLCIDSQDNIYSGSSDNTIRKISSYGVEIWKFAGHASSVYSVCIDSSGNIISGSADTTVRKISSQGTEIWRYGGNSTAVSAVCIDLENNVCSGTNGGVLTKITSGGTQIWSVKRHVRDITSLCVDSQNNIISASLDAEVTKTSSKGVKIWIFRASDRANIISLSVDSEDNFISGHNNGVITKISSQGTEIWKFTGHTDFVNSLCVDSQNNIISGSRDKTLKKISPQGKEIWKFTDHTAIVDCINIDSQNNIVSGAQDNIIRKFQQNLGILITKDHQSEIHKVTKLDTIVKEVLPAPTEVWDKIQGGYVYSICIDLNNNIISGNYDRIVKKISPTGEEIWCYKGHESGVYSVCVDLQNNIYSCSSDITLRKISSSGAEIWRFTGHTGTVRS